MLRRYKDLAKLARTSADQKTTDCTEKSKKNISTTQQTASISTTSGSSTTCSPSSASTPFASTTSRRYVRRLCLATLGARRRTLAQTIGNVRGLDINSPLSTEVHTEDLRFRRHQQRDDPNNARGLDNNFASDRGCDSTTTYLPPHRRLRSC
jgi:hypothetical protein